MMVVILNVITMIAQRLAWVWLLQEDIEYGGSEMRAAGFKGGEILHPPQTLSQARLD